MRFLNIVLKIFQRFINIIGLLVFVLVLYFALSNKFSPNWKARKDIFYEKLGVADSVEVNVTENFGVRRKFSFSIDSQELLKYLPKVDSFSKVHHTKINAVYICYVEFSDKEVHILEFYRGKTVSVNGVFISVADDSLLEKILSYSPYEKKINPSWYKPLFK